MERLFAPWRHSYVTSSHSNDDAACVMCEAPRASAEDSLVVHVGDTAFVLMNLYPYTSGHTMIAPLRHVGCLADAELGELAEMMGLARRLETIMRELYRPDGLNVGMNLGEAAGAGVADHIHLHVVPRWSGDANFMTTVGHTRVIPEDPREACPRLRERFQRS